MFNVGGPELIVILLVALLVLGPTKLPDAARQMGKAMNEFRRMSTGFRAELRDALNEPVDTTPRGTTRAAGGDFGVPTGDGGNGSGPAPVPPAGDTGGRENAAG